MKYCTKCGHMLVDEAVVCPKCGCRAAVVPKEDKVSIPLCILLGHVWLAALIYWAATRQETPKRAKAVALSPLFVGGFWFVAYFIFIFILVGLTGTA